VSDERRTLITRDVLAAIRLGEDSGYDFKAIHIKGARIFERIDDVADDIAAFANALGGRLVLGVEDRSRNVVGINLADLDRVEQELRNIALNKIEPNVAIDSWRIEVPNASGDLKALLVIDIARSLFVHRSPGGYRRRFSASQRQMTTEELQRLLQSRSQARSVGFDELAVPRTLDSDLDRILAARFAAANDAASYRKLHLITPDVDHVLRLSVAAVLLCTVNPQLHFPGAYIQCVHYPETARSEGGQLDAFDATGTLDAQIDASLAWLQRRMSTSARKAPYRLETPEFDTLALFEAIVNAVVHRDYSIRGSRIRLHLFPDRLELYSPGALANTLTVDALAERQYVRNDLIASLLGRIGVSHSETLPARRYLERRGDGVPMILARSEALSGRAPVYELIAEVELKLTIFAAVGE